MKQELITTKTSKKALDLLRLEAAKTGKKQYEVMEMALQALDLLRLLYRNQKPYPSAKEEDGLEQVGFAHGANMHAARTKSLMKTHCEKMAFSLAE